VSTTAPGQRGRPTRTHLARVERGNPVEVRTPAGGFGRSTVRKAEFLGGNRMAQEANAGPPKGTGKTGLQRPLQVVVSDNRPETGVFCPDPKGS
jgi:hypothetical protein